MLGKVKKWLGIEGVKLELVISEENIVPGRIEGMVRLMSMQPQTVMAIKIVLIEKYTRGRGEERLVDEYQLGSVVLTEITEVPSETIVERHFSLPYSRLLSDVDQFGRRNPVFGGLAAAARWTRGVKSEYRLEAEAQVKGVALNPFDRQEIVLPK